MPAIPGRNHGHIRIRRKSSIRESLKRHKRIILRRKNQSRHANLRNHPQRTSPVIIIVRIPKSAKPRRNHVIKFPHSPHTPKPIERISPRIQSRLQPHAPLQAINKMPLVNKIPRLRQIIRASSQINRRTNPDHALQFRRRLRPKLPSHLQNNVPAHRRPSHKNLLQRILRNQLVHHSPHIPAQPRVVKRRRQMRRPPAIPLVHPQHIERSPKCLLRRPQHVPRFTRSLKPMQQNQSRPPPRLHLPMTLSKNPRPSLHLKLPRHTSPQRRKLPRPKCSRKRHQMGIPQKRRRSKFKHKEKSTIGSQTAQQAKHRVPHAPPLRVGLLTPPKDLNFFEPEFLN